jgi:O-antigen biosynthesis protein
MINALRRLCSALWYTITSPDYRLLKRSRLFDDAYYLRTNPDLQGSAYDPLAHYLTRGFQELRRPGPFFDHHFYMQQCPEVEEEQRNPLLHFLTKGRYQGLVPNPLVDPHWYSKTLGENRPALPDPLSHFLSQQKTANPPLTPSPYFDPAFYGQCYEDAQLLAGQAEAAYRHFLEYGQKAHRRPSSYFDSDYYLDKAPGLREQGYDALTHYALFGRRERKSPSPLFDPLFYKERYQPAENLDPFAHYLCRQDDLEVRPCSWFDPGFYRRTYLHEDPTPPLKHFLEKGLRQGFHPNGDIAGLAVKPLISVVLPVYNVASAHLNTCIRSVLYQSYPHWQLCLADDCSSDPTIRPLLRHWLGEDPRITAVFLEHNAGISAATNAAAGLATGDYLLFLDHDDELAPEAMAIFAEHINRQPADLYYSDEDLIGADGRQFSIFRKPGFNAELLLCHNYVTHCVVTKRALYETVGGCDSAHDGAQDLDLFLKLSERADRVVHIPEILYHWRASEKSTSINHQEKHYADEAGRNCVAAALARRGINGEVLACEWKFFYRAKRALQPNAKVTLVIDWRRHQPQHRDIPSLVATAGATISKILILATDIKETPPPPVGSKAPGPSFRLLACPRGRSTASVFAEIINADDSDYLAWLDGSLRPQSDQWLSALLEYGQSQEVAMVRGQLAYDPQDHPDITPIADIAQQSPLYFARFLADCSILMNGGQCPQEVMAVAGGVFLLRTAWLHTHPELMESNFLESFFFLDLSLRLHQGGAKNIYTPYCSCKLISAPRQANFEDAPNTSIEEQRRFQAQWTEVLASTIPFYNTRIIGDANHSEQDFLRWLTGKGS